VGGASGEKPLAFSPQGGGQIKGLPKRWDVSCLWGSAIFNQKKGGKKVAQGGANVGISERRKENREYREEKKCLPHRHSRNKLYRHSQRKRKKAPKKHALILSGEQSEGGGGGGGGGGGCGGGGGGVQQKA